MVTWNCEDHIAQCLESLQRYGPSDNQIIVVDNHSTDLTVKEVEWFSQDYHEVNLIKNDRNMGLGYATCQAEKLIKHDLVLVSNPDIVFTGLPSLLEYAYNHPEKECMMPALEGSEKGTYGRPEKAIHWKRYPHFLSFSLGSKLDNTFNHFLTNYCMNGSRVPATAEEISRQIEDDKHVYGVSCMLLRKSLIQRIGGIYQPYYFWAWADADLGMRLSQYHCQGAGVPEAAMKHHGGYSSQKLSDDAKVFLAANGQKNWEKDWGHASRYFMAQLLDTVIVSAWKRQVPRSKIMLLKGWLS